MSAQVQSLLSCVHSRPRPGEIPRRSLPGPHGAMPIPVSLTEISTEPSACLALRFYPSSLRRELHCIGKKVEKDLFDLALVADEARQDARLRRGPVL